MDEMQEYMQRHMRSMYRIARCRHAIFREFMSDYGVTLHQFHLLMYLKIARDAKVSELSEHMLVSMPTTSRMVDTLCGFGLARKKKSGSDRRSTYVEITEKGDEVLESMLQKQFGIVRSIMENIDEEDVDAFIRVTEKIADELVSVLGLEGLQRGGGEEKGE